MELMAAAEHFTPLTQVVSIDALSREALHTIFSNVLGSVPAIAALNLRRALGPLRPVVLPVATPLEVMSRCGRSSTLAGRQSPASCCGSAEFAVPLLVLLSAPLCMAHVCGGQI